ncbi:Hypothetical protein NTJ_08157 [Nesidiocoris tenuis]|uniref:Lipid-binding serum glycoprotein N-terminal domain-containing protein n=1 Tax=Nesidiocoris tenuis TaxID=355587 RepID=A0ABN7ATS2_9HEMI|nr:Hypothetical protein NTJ_08157 [Nesidiocoris tenuis]
MSRFVFGFALIVLTNLSTVFGSEDSGPSPSPVKVASLNKYLDVVIANFVSSVESKDLNPLVLPNASLPITSKWYFPYEHLTLTDGLLHNIESIKRHGDCWIAYGNDTIEITIDAALTDLYVEYDFNASSPYYLLSLMGLLHGEVGQTQVVIDLTIDTPTMAIRANKISFPGAKKLDFSIRSTILATWMVNIILEVVTIAAGLLMNDVEAAVTSAINDFLTNHIPHMITQSF